MRVVAILQARMSSTRLPGKMLLPLLDKPLVQHVIERVMRATKLDEVVLAYPLLDHESFFPMTRTGCSMYAYPGNENDLVDRYLGSANLYAADIIVRIPCDNPCVDPYYIDQAIDDYQADPHVFYSNTTALVSLPDKKPTKYSSGKSARWVDGVGAEVISKSRLKWLDAKTNEHPIHREHPHKYFLDRYEDNDSTDYGIVFGAGEEDIRLDVNTQSDYEFIKYIYDHFGHNRFTAAEVLAYLERKKVSA